MTAGRAEVADDGTPAHVTGGDGLRSRVASQGALLAVGLGASQALSFARNALIAHMLSKGDFGIAATLTLMLQMVDALSDLGVDRLLVQARDGDEPQLQAVAQALLVARGIVTGLALLIVAPTITRFFRLDDALWAFQAIALVPVVKGFQHLDQRRDQRRLDNRGVMLIEVVPQAAVLALTLPVLAFVPGYAAAVWLALAQAILAVATSHVLARRRYRLALDGANVRRFLAFGWPILASALPLAAIYQGDRIIIGRLGGMEQLAAYSTAFMVTIVPGLVAAKIANALMLPLLAQTCRAGAPMLPRYRQMCDATALAASIYLAGFLVAGGAVLPVAFGPQYAGLADVVGWLALMWALRMLQAVPGMALMAASCTRPLLVAGLLRAAALLPAYLAAQSGAGLAGIAAVGCLGEVVSLVYVAWRAARLETGLAAALLSRTAALVPAGGAALVAVAALPPHASLLASCSAAASVTMLLAGLALLGSSALRSLARPILARAVPA